MSLEKRCNGLLAQSLGSLGGKPRYQWKRGETLYISKRVLTNEEIPQPVLEYRCPCGLLPEAKVHLPTCSGLLLPHPVYVMELMNPNLVGFWVFCRWMRAEEFAEVRDAFGDYQKWKDGGHFFPVSGETGEIYFSTLSIQTTLDLVEAIKRQEEFGVDKVLEKRDQKVAVARKDQRRKMEGMIREDLPLFDGEPGSRSRPLWIRRAEQEKCIEET